MTAAVFKGSASVITKKVLRLLSCLKGNASVILNAVKNLSRSEQPPGEDPSLRSGRQQRVAQDDSNGSLRMTAAVFKGSASVITKKVLRLLSCLKGNASVILNAVKNLSRSEQPPGEDPSLRSG
jgi:hypothetical protein